MIWTYTAVTSFMVLVTAAGLHNLNIHCGWSTWSEHTLQLVYMIWTYTAVTIFMVLLTATGLHNLNIHCSWSTRSEHTLRWSNSWFCSLQPVYTIWTYTAVIKFMVLFTAAGLHDLNIHCSWSTRSEHTLRWSISWFCSLQPVYTIWTYTAVINFTKYFPFLMGMGGITENCGSCLPLWVT